MYFTSYLYGKDFRMFSTAPFSSIFDLLKAFPTEQSCIDFLEKVIWKGNVVSPFDSTSKVYKCHNNKYKCKNTNKYFNVRTGTIFEGTKIPLRQWFLTIYLFTSHKKGISSHQLAKDIDITQKTAWFMLQRIRYGMEHASFLKRMEGTIEVDETFVGGKNKNRHKDKKVENSQGRSFKDKTPVMGMLEREISTQTERPHKLIPGKVVKEKLITKESRITCRVVPDTKAKSVQPIIFNTVKDGSTVYSDEWWAYNGLNKSYNHSIIDHARGQYKNEDTCTNSIEGFWSHLKRGIFGIYHQVSRKHLQKYANEFVFRYNFRKETTSNRFNLFLQATSGKRLTYHCLINKT